MPSHSSSPKTRPYVITGVSRTVRADIVEALRDSGYHVCSDAAACILREQATIGGEGLPWINPELYLELVLSMQMRSYADMLEWGMPTFSVGGAPDLLAYARVEGIPIPFHLRRAVKIMRYQPQVFVSLTGPKAPEETDHPRLAQVNARQSFDYMVQAYRDSGYVLREIPQGSLESRVSFIVDHISNATSSTPSVV